MTGKSARTKPAITPLPGRVPGARVWDRLGFLVRYRFAFVVVIAVAFAVVGQLVEDAADGVVRMTMPSQSIRRWTLVVLVVYELVMTAVVYRTVQRSLRSLRTAVKLDEAAFGTYVRAVRVRDWSTDLLLLLASAAIVGILFLGVPLDLLGDLPNQSLGLPQAPISALLVLAGYTVLGWAGLKLLYVAAQFGRLLGRLSREPLHVNVFDTTALLPFGNIALAVALAPAGIIAILLIGLGPPTSSLVAWAVLVLASFASLLALLLPLRGVHRQMSDAKDAALDTVNSRIGQLFDEVSRTSGLDPIQMTRFSDSSGALIPLRRTIAEMTTWPFRDTVALARAVLIASAPLIYATLSELIKIFLGR